MGNCLESGKNQNQNQASSKDRLGYLDQPCDEESQVQFEREEYGSSSPAPAAAAAGKTRKVKILLTKEESEWLMFELKKTQGKKVEELLGEIVRSRERNSCNSGWKPCLDSITESSQILEGMDR